ncbi:MAG: DegT/DnrJ/EryC1/StrS family aminotransferase [Candidatus Jettenia caeni]|nr:DegT/DnrJ/EryC1/StrS family aminotransferase [Candidatus Jettenia caeni]
MKLLIPSAGMPVSFPNIVKGLLVSLNQPINTFESAMKVYTNKKYCYFTNSGITAFYIILKAIRNISEKTEVIIPAYTCPSLVIAIRKAGLKPVLCDISLKTFNMDIQSINTYTQENTLCIVPAHTFGLPIDMEAIINIAQKKSLLVVENATSSLGTTIHQRPTGTFGDVGFYSFDQEKNFSTLSGGCIITDREDIAKFIETECASLPQPGLISKLNITARLFALAFAAYPVFYTVFYNLTPKLKNTTLHADFHSFAYTKFQAGIGYTLFKHAFELFNKRFDHGIFLFDMLNGIKGIKIPELHPYAVPVFNQFPILFDNKNIKETFLKRINDTGIKIVLPYHNPIHRMYDLGYDLYEDPFPNATYFSRRLLLIPTHPMMNIEKLSKIVSIIKTGLEDDLNDKLMYPSQL